MHQEKHHHSDGCGCGCGHEHEHEHDHCGCEHEHDHCGCGHEHHHEHSDHCCHDHHDRGRRHGKGPGRVYRIQGLDCANCAAKIEARLRTLEGVEDCTITFATMQLRLWAEDPDALLPRIQQTIDSMEDGVRVLPPEEKSAAPETDPRRELLFILLGGLLLIAGVVLEKCVSVPAALAALLPAYLILGGGVLMTALRNIRKGRVFDENFLMSLATLGAFAIGNYPEAVGVMLFYRVGEYFEERAVEKSRKQIMDAVDLRPETVNLVEDGEIRVTAAELARVGDILLVRPGDRIPLDGVILEGESRIDTSPVTGEPVPVAVRPGDRLLSGCVNTSGAIKLRVEKPLSESMVTRILNSVENAAASKPAMDKFITRFARVYTPAVVITALAAALLLPFVLPGWHFFVDPAYTGAATVWKAATGTASVFTALTFLVISCPCALVLSVPLAFFSGIGTASKKGILFKGGSTIEALSGIKAVAMDKTGTITRGNFQVQELLPGSESVTPEALLLIAAGCELHSTHPIAMSIVSAAGERGLTPVAPLEVEEIPGRGIRAVTAAGVVLCGSRELLAENGVPLPASDSAYGTEVLVAREGAYLGTLRICDTLKEDAVEAVARIRRMGIFTALLTGDGRESGEYVARRTGIDQVHARLLPEDKLTQLRNIREARGAVMFVGDGINDAPVLAGADVGAAMGSGADAAIEAADVVFMTSGMSAIPEALGIARQTRRIAWQNVYFALAVKLVVMVMGLLGFANMWVAVFADTGVAMLCLLNSVRLLRME